MKQILDEIFALHAAFCRTMGNTKRLMILSMLADGELNVGEIASGIGVSMANASQHLSALKSANIVQSRKNGQLVYYQLTDPRITEACDLIRSVLLSYMKKGGSIANQVDRKTQTFLSNSIDT
jgi:ArsR family transcriptional regulator